MLGVAQDGITGIETAIVLIAFVVVASVFAFAMLSTGFLSSEKSKAAVLGGLAETSATLSLRGGVVAVANAGKTAVDTIKFTVTSAAQSTESVDLSTSGTTVTYVDQDNGVNCTGSGSPSCSWSTTWLIGSGSLIDQGEQVEFTVTLTGLSPKLGKGAEFTIQVKPNKGAVVVVNRTTPVELKTSMDLH